MLIMKRCISDPRYDRGKLHGNDKEKVKGIVYMNLIIFSSDHGIEVESIN